MRRRVAAALMLGSLAAGRWAADATLARFPPGGLFPRVASGAAERRGDIRPDQMPAPGAGTVGGHGVAVVGPRPALWPPSFAAVRAAYMPSDLWVLDRHGEVLSSTRVGMNGRRLAWTPVAAVAPTLTQALIAVEDRRFAGHEGVDWWAAAGVLRELVHGRLRGASTLTMQLAGLLDPALARRGARPVAGKLAQAWAALRLERVWSKGEILEAYLNFVTFHGELVGVAAASHGLFGKEPHGLTHAEAALLASLIATPRAAAGPAARRACILARARQLDVACGDLEELADQALGSGRLGAVGLAETGDAASRSDGSDDRRGAEEPRAPKRDAKGPFGALGSSAPRRSPESDQIPAGDLAPHAARLLLAHGPRLGAVTTSIDGGLQRFAARELAAQLAELAGRNVRDGAVLVVDNATGQILAYVGSSPATSPAPFVDGVRARRQAGSSLKPFLYALALEQNLLTAATLLDDSPVELPVTGGLYRPRNYDERFHGPVPVRTALAASLNVPAVKTLLLVGTDAFLGRLKDLGFGVAHAADWFGPALALGAIDVSLWELTAAYRALATSGEAGELTLKADGNDAARRHPVIDPRAAFIISDILADRDARALTFGLESYLSTPFFAAVKTGTSKDMRDNWCIGFSEAETVGVWVGNFDGEPMWNVSGVSGAAPVWLSLMRHLHAEGRESAHPPPPPPGVTRAAYIGMDGRERTDWFMAGTAPHAIEVADEPGAGRPRLTYPVDGMVLAVDPDIPADRQLLVPEVVPPGAPARLALDGRPLARDATLAVAHLAAGLHVLVLDDLAGRRLSTVRFRVSGGGRKDAGG